jgi:multiple sugar transport system permease protein
MSAGFVLLILSWLVWRRAGQHDSTIGMLLRLGGAAMLLIGAWILIGELPRVIAAGDDDWWQGLKVTAYYSIGTVPFQLGISLLLATLLFQNIRGKGFFRLIYFLPYITPAVAAAGVFRVFFSSRPTAPINSLLNLFNASPLLWLDEPKGILQMIAGSGVTLPEWAAGPSLALVVVIIYNIWSYVGYDTVIFLAGLGSIPSELYEAAAIDGAGRFAQFRHITFPLLSPTTYFLTLLAVIGTFKAFNHVWVLRSGAALGTTDTASIVIFNEFNRNTRYGYAASLALLLLGVIMILTIVNNRIAEERVFYG